MRLLLDTHIVLQLLTEPKRVDRDTRALIERSDAYVSSASLWEISIKTALGKLKVKPAEIFNALEPTGFSLLAVQGEHSVRVYDLGPFHQDPFDRLLIAQAQIEALTLLTYDDTLAAYGPSVQVV
jgi:PIN domain nuclease of toxin-antitoxin system